MGLFLRNPPLSVALLDAQKCEKENGNAYKTSKEKVEAEFGLVTLGVNEKALRAFVTYKREKALSQSEARTHTKNETEEVEEAAVAHATIVDSALGVRTVVGGKQSFVFVFFRRD